jgi:glucosamine-6-phosphate deaminase
MPTRKVKMWTSKVEETATQHSGQALRYPPTEKINIIVVANIMELGKLAALRFMEWAQNNEGWSFSLPTGRTPELFSRWVSRILSTWESRETQKLLDTSGVDPDHKPDMRSFHFIQIDELYPSTVARPDSLFYFINKFYLKGFNLDPKKALLINPGLIGIPVNESLSSIWPDESVPVELRTRRPGTDLEKKQKKLLEAVDQFCTDYESKIQALGGIGFFLGCIGADGHIGFNVGGSDHYSTTRLTSVHFKTFAAGATAAYADDMEIYQNHLGITIGLRTIVRNPATTAVIMAAGETEADAVRDAAQQPKDNRYPATVLQDLENSCFYLTRMAGKQLTERRYLEILNRKPIQKPDTHRILIDTALEKNKRLADLSRQDLAHLRGNKELYDTVRDMFKESIVELEPELVKRFVTTPLMPHSQVFLHTAPQHMELVTGYFPYLIQLIQETTNIHYFNYLTSRSTSITNSYMYHLLEILRSFLNRPEFSQLGRRNYFDPLNPILRQQDVMLYLDGIATRSDGLRDEAVSRRLLRNLVEIFEDDHFNNLIRHVDELLNYFRTPLPLKKELHHIRQLKGMIHEWESDLMWGHFGIGSEAVIHSRLGFYKGDPFINEPVSDRDIAQIVKSLKKTNPTIVTVALTPDSGYTEKADTLLYILAQALQIYRKENNRPDIEIWGYRPAWFPFHPSEADIYYPVPLNSYAVSVFTFINSFGSHSASIFPRYEHDGPLVELAQKIQVKQFRQMTTLLGKDYFSEHPSPLLRTTAGMVYLKRMTADEFFNVAGELKKSFEK